MTSQTLTLRRTVISAVLAAAFPLAAGAAEPLEALQAQIEALQKQLEQLRNEVTQQRSGGASQDLAAEVSKLKQEVKSAQEWKQANTVIHLAGYADAGYTDTKNASGTFTPFSFNPIFHFQYKDLLLVEAEPSISIDETGETTVDLEYAALNLFLGDHAALVAGKFQSPIGQFRQNLHPSWINKLPSAPTGFGHGGAAPIAEVGIQLRGGAPLGAGENRVNYAVYVGNGPEVEIEDGEIEMVESEGFGRDRDGSKVWGGRIGFFVPSQRLDLGLSAATGKVAGMMESDIKRDYEVVGADFAWRPARFELRGEYVRQKVGDAAVSAAPEGGEWKAWYLQASHRLGNTNWEPVLRYGRLDTPHASGNQKQWALGLNYLFASNVFAKAAYEFNDSLKGAATDDDRLLVQLSYGF